MALPGKRHYSIEEYTELLLESDTKLEYINGQIYAMAGAKTPHIRIGTRLTSILDFGLRNCETFNSDQRVYVQPTGNYYFPDITVACGDILFKEDESVSTILNPKVVIEILSPSTELLDRRTKFYDYIQIPSLEDYLLVAQDEPRIERFSRGEELWTVLKVEGLDGSIEIPSLSLTLKLAEVYERVEFPPQN